MVRKTRCHALLLVGTLLSTAALADDASPTKTEKDDMPKTTVHQFAAKDIDGKEVALSTYEGDVLLIVNVASK